MKKETPLTKEKKECNENWHIFQPTGAEVCNCGKSTNNPLKQLAKEVKKNDPPYYQLIN